MGILGMVVAGSTALGAPFGGLLTATVGWPAVFESVVPLALVGLAVSYRHLRVTEVAPAVARPFDVGGAGLFVMGTILLMATVTQGATPGTPPWAMAILASGALAAFGAFGWVERQRSHPFIPLSLVGQRAYGGISLVRALQMAILYGTLFWFPYIGYMSVA